VLPSYWGASSASNRGGAHGAGHRCPVEVRFSDIARSVGLRILAPADLLTVLTWVAQLAIQRLAELIGQKGTFLWLFCEL